MATNEMKLIWTRYAGFLVIQGFMIKLLFDNYNSNNLIIYFLLSILGYLISIIWIILNYSGWFNQNTYIKNASQLNFEKIEIDLITNKWRDFKKSKPTGVIYYIAQIIPSLFIIAYSSLIAYYSYKLLIDKIYICISIGIGILLIIISFIIILILQNIISKNDLL